jgi:hypothetical protein
MTLSVGDRILIKSRFDDGWAYGINMDTKQEGNFPLACVAGLDDDVEDGSDMRDSWAYSKRTSSLNGGGVRYLNHTSMYSSQQ